MNSRVHVLDGSGTDPEAVGGKAAALDQLIGWGLPVPPCAVVTTSTYWSAVRGSQAARVIAELQREPAPSPARIEAELQRVEEAFAELALPSGLEDQLIRVGESIAGGGRIAVRSSATTEDARGTSFAGQYRSILDVGPEGLADALRRVWASLWSPQARSYREACGADEEGIAMAVVLMRMVDPDYAGVLFTADPHGRPRDMRVELVEGLADGLVRGQQTPRSIVLPRSGPRCVPDHMGPLVDRLLHLGTAVEERSGSPQDIEWVARDEQVLLVQARPITTPGVPHDDGFDSVTSTDASYTTAGIVEALPGVLPPLLWSLNGPMLEEAFRKLFDSLGVTPPLHDRVIVRVRGRAAINLDVLRSIATAAGGSAAEFERQYFGAPVSPDDANDTDDRSAPRGCGRLRLAKASLRAARMHYALGREAAALGHAIDGVLDSRVRVDELGPHELSAYRDQLHDLAARAVAAQVAVAVAAVATFDTLEVFLEKYVGQEAHVLAQGLTTMEAAAAAGGAAALELDAMMELAGVEEFRAVVTESGDDPGADDREAGDPDAIEDKLKGIPAGRELVEAARAAAGRAGSRSVFAGPTWEERMSDVWNALEARLGGPASAEQSSMNHRRVTLGDVERRLTSSLRWLLTRVLTGQVVDVRLRLLRRLVEDATRWLALREEMKLAVLRLCGESRRTARRAGSLLRASGAIDEDTDVELMSDLELGDALRGNGPSRRRLASRRRALARANASGDLPRSFVGWPSDVDREDVDHGEDGEAVDGQEFRGWAASAGQHRGQPRVVRDLQSAQLDPGDVLVARSTDPSWTPLFLSAGAIVVEEGGPLSHAAIVARELGLPAVVNVPSATERLAEAEWVTVDGNLGVVRVDEGDKAGRASADTAGNISPDMASETAT